MSTALTGTLVNSASTILSAYTPGNVGIAADATGSFAYVADAKSASGKGRVFKCQLTTPYTVTQINVDSVITQPSGLCFDPTYTFLYVLCDAGAIYTMPVATGVPTLLGTMNGVDSQTSGWRECYLDPLYPTRLIIWNNGARKFYQFDTVATTGAAIFAYSSQFLQHGYVQRGALTDRLHTCFSFATSGYTILAQLRQGPVYQQILGGDGGNADQTGPALTSSLNGLTCLCADQNERIYFGTSTGTKVKSIIGGTLANLYSAGATPNAVCFEPVNNVLLLTITAALVILS